MAYKVHIQLSPFNGKSYDYLEADVENVGDIELIYAELVATYGEAKAPAPAPATKAPTSNFEQVGSPKTESNGAPYQPSVKQLSALAKFKLLDPNGGVPADWKQKLDDKIKSLPPRQ